MSYDTARVNQLAIEPSDAVLELGFGHGRTILQVAPPRGITTRKKIG